MLRLCAGRPFSRICFFICMVSFTTSSFKTSYTDHRSKKTVQKSVAATLDSITPVNHKDELHPVMLLRGRRVFIVISSTPRA